MSEAEVARLRALLEEVVPWAVLATWRALEENLAPPFDPAAARQLQRRLGAIHNAALPGFILDKRKRGVPYAGLDAGGRIVRWGPEDNYAEGHPIDVSPEGLAAMEAALDDLPHDEDTSPM